MPEEEGKARGSIFLHFCFSLTQQSSQHSRNSEKSIHQPQFISFLAVYFLQNWKTTCWTHRGMGWETMKGKYFFSLKSKIISYVNNQQCNKSKKRYSKGRNIAKIVLRVLTLCLDWPTSYSTDLGNLISATWNQCHLFYCGAKKSCLIKMKSDMTAFRKTRILTIFFNFLHLIIYLLTFCVGS